MRERHGIDGQHQTAEHCCAVDLDGTCAALAEFAAVLGAGQGHLFSVSEDLQQGLIWHKCHLVRLAVHSERPEHLVELGQLNSVMGASSRATPTLQMKRASRQSREQPRSRPGYWIVTGRAFGNTVRKTGNVGASTVIPVA